VDDDVIDQTDNDRTDNDPSDDNQANGGLLGDMVDVDAERSSFDRAIAWVRSDTGAAYGFAAAFVGSLILFVAVGRRQWFIRDDWAFLLTRNKMRTILGLDDMLLAPQDGHWMTGPILVYRAIQNVFGIDSYWPYLTAVLATHIGIVFLVRMLCRRLEVSAWTTTMICSVLLVFGSGWENILFAIQITYNFSLLAFLAQLLLVDHDDAPDRRDYIGVAISIIGVSSSGFGPFFILGIGVFLVLRRRWLAAAIATVPQAVAWCWWWLTWGADPAGDAADSTIGSTARFTKNGLFNTFGGLAGSLTLAGTAALIAIAVCLWRGVRYRRLTMLVTLWIVAGAMYAGVGLQRSGISAAATESRYQHIAAVLLAPVLALGLDQAHRFAPWARHVPRAVLMVAVGRNAMILSDLGGDWANRAQAERNVLGYVAGSDVPTSLDAGYVLLEFSPDVRAGDIGFLVAEGAVDPIVPATEAEQAIAESVLSTPQP
jgi:hypothetical protein